jgi:hypothetical protein
LSFEAFTSKVEVVEDNFCESLIKDLILKFHILDRDEKEIENVNKGGCQTSKHV